MECDIMNRLFDLDLDELIQNIFLNLDPLSLKSCKCVSSEWFHFIQNRLWNSKPAKKQLHNRLINQWKFSEPFLTEYEQEMMGVNFLVCDDDIIVCGYTWGQARVHDVDTGELRYQLQCDSHSLGDDEYGVQLDLGRTVIGSVTDNGFVSIWKKTDGSLLYQAKHHGEHQSVFGIKVTDEYVLTGGGDGSLIMLEKVEGVWKITHEMFENRDGVTHIDADGKWAVTGSRQSIKLWDLEKHKIVESVKAVKVKVWMLSFTYPYAYVVGGEDWNGVQIWDLSKSELVRHVAIGKPFHNVHFNGCFLTVSEFNITCRGENDEKVTVAVYDALELLDKKIETKTLWKKTFEYSPGAYFEQINAVSNKTSLIVTHDTNISILNFWKDRKMPSSEVVPAEKKMKIGKLKSLLQRWMRKTK